MNKLSSVYKEFRHFLRRLSERVFWLPELLSPKGHIYVYISSPYYVKDNCNWGDDLNRYLVEAISGKKVVHARCQLLRKKYYLCIGSILQWHTSKYSEVWGSGLIEPSDVQSCNRIHAVRGPLTRKELIRQGYDCPEVYGDPALLLPRFYQPKGDKKKYKLGLICHYKEKNTDIIAKLTKNPDIHFIDVMNYGKITDFIEEIHSCEYIISSSLHGCIVSDTYGIPNLWCRFTSYKAEGNNFKFHDYYESVNKGHIKDPYIFSEEKTIDEITDIISGTWTLPEIDLDKLYNSCPFRKQDLLK